MGRETHAVRSSMTIHLSQCFEGCRCTSSINISNINRTKARIDRDRLQDQVDAAATVIAALYDENAALREQISSQSAIVVPLSPRR
jgi:hypothetical protein